MNSTQSTTLSPAFRRNILFALVFPVCLLILGIYHGFIQVLYRAGIIHASSFLGLEYYQGLTLHGVVNAIVFTTFFEVTFGHLVMHFYLKKQPGIAWVRTSLYMMTIGTIVAALPILGGAASVLYTFYPPLKAHPAFYIGATLLVVGSWVAFFSWIPLYLAWRRENPNSKTPLAVVGMLSTFIVWLMATLPLAYEVLFMLIPWAIGWTHDINPVLARTLFWFFGHPLVYFWLLPSYVMFYVTLPKLVGGKLFSDFAGRFAFMMFVVFSAPIGVHHQFADPGIAAGWKWFHTVLTFCVAIPSFMTAFTLAASLEHGAKQAGGRGWFSWWKKLPYFDEERWLFAYLFCGLILFLYGGITGIINASAVMNRVVHNTAWIPGHFHTTVGGPVFLSFIGMTLYLIPQITGKKLKFKKLALWTPYLWLGGMAFFSVGMAIGAFSGEPRRTNLGLSYVDKASALFHPNWVLTTGMAAFGGTIMTIGCVFYFMSFFGTLFGARQSEASTDQLSIPTSEVLHDENISWVLNFKPWIIAACLTLLVAYGPLIVSLAQAINKPASPPFSPSSPMAITSENR